MESCQLPWLHAEFCSRSKGNPLVNKDSTVEQNVQAISIDTSACNLLLGHLKQTGFCIFMCIFHNSLTNLTGHLCWNLTLSVSMSKAASFSIAEFDHMFDLHVFFIIWCPIPKVNYLA